MITGARIRARRVAAGISLRELASELRLTAVELGEIERGKRSVEFFRYLRGWDRLLELFPGIDNEVDPVADAHEATMASMWEPDPADPNGPNWTVRTAKLGWVPGEFSNTLEQARQHLPTKESMKAALDRAEASLADPRRRQTACRWCGSTEQLERTETGWRCVSCLTGADAESPDYEALGYPETGVGYVGDLDGARELYVNGTCWVELIALTPNATHVFKPRAEDNG